nr:MAG TPA: hypothetical protein [Caudoviricetes sp.]
MHTELHRQCRHNPHSQPSGLRGGDARHRTGGMAYETSARGGAAGHV